MYCMYGQFKKPWKLCSEMGESRPMHVPQRLAQVWRRAAEAWEKETWGFWNYGAIPCRPYWENLPVHLVSVPTACGTYKHTSITIYAALIPAKFSLTCNDVMCMNNLNVCTLKPSFIYFFSVRLLQAQVGTILFLWLPSINREVANKPLSSPVPYGWTWRQRCWWIKTMWGPQRSDTATKINA